MKRLIPFLVVLASALAAPSASADYWRKCGSQHHPGAGWYHVKAHGIGCAKARAVARHWRGPETSPLHFNCQYHSAGYELGNIACRRERGRLVQKVRFQVGA